MSALVPLMLVLVVVLIALSILTRSGDDHVGQHHSGPLVAGARRIRLHLEDRGFVCSLNLDGKRSMLFLLDTGFAGMPIFNSSHSSPPVGCSPLGETFRFSLASLGRVESHTAEQVACPVHLHAADDKGAHSRRFLLMDLDRETPHILTIDFLLSWGGCARLQLGGKTPSLAMGGEDALPEASVGVATREINGAYAIRLSILGGGDDGAPREGWFVVDTGSPAPLTVGRSFGEALRLKGGHRSPEERFVKQIGVNRESICSLVSRRVVARVTGTHLGMVTPLLLNDVDAPVEGSDGYIGLGMLMMWRSISFRRGGDGVVSLYIEAAEGSDDELPRADTRLIDDAMRSSCS